MTERSCGNCHACCQGCLTSGAPDIHFGDGNGCVKLWAETGCSIYKDRPQVCRDFFCGWIVDTDLHDDIRPDKSNAILLKNKFSWCGYQVDYVVPVDLVVPEEAIKYFREYSLKFGRPIIIQEFSINDSGKRERFIEPFGPSGFAEYVINASRDGEDFL